jgi:uncharacterized phage protein gp47/JayE
MSTFGITPTGFVAPSSGEILALIEAEQRADLSATLDLSEQSLLGQLNRVYARRIAEAWSALQAIYDGGDPDQAAADSLTSLMKITATGRRGAAYSRVPMTVSLEAGTTLEAGVHFAQVSGKPDVRWTPTEDFTAPDNGTFQLLFRSEQAGAIDTPVGSITTIATPVIGWSAITASGEVAVGHTIDDDNDARARREDSLQRTGSSSVDAVRADVLALDGAIACTIFENSTDAVDAQGLPPMAFEVIVDAVGTSDDAIAQAIWNTKAGGIETVGAESGTAFDAEGNPHVMRFSRTQQVAVWISYQLERLEGYGGDELFRATIASRLDAALKPGEAVSEWDVADAAHGLGIRLRGLAFGLAPGPTSKAEIAIGVRQVARFDAGRVELT